MAIVAYIDGGARGNPGPAGYGVRIEDEQGTLVNEFNGFLGTSTNNVAEYNGLLAALKYAQQHGHRTVRIKSDSELLVKQMRGEYKVKNAGLLPLYQQARTIAQTLDRIVYEHVRREQNKDADRLANLAMDEGTKPGLGIRDWGFGISETETRCGREPLVETIVRFLAHERASDAREIRECVERAIDESGPGAIDSLSARLLRAGTDWAYYPHDPLARRIHHALASRVLQPEPVVDGTHHLDAVEGQAARDLRESSVVLGCERRRGAAAQCRRLLSGRSADGDCRAEGVFRSHPPLLEPVLRHHQSAAKLGAVERGRRDEPARGRARGAPCD